MSVHPRRRFELRVRNQSPEEISTSYIQGHMGSQVSGSEDSSWLDANVNARIPEHTLDEDYGHEYDPDYNPDSQFADEEMDDTSVASTPEHPREKNPILMCGERPYTEWSGPSDEPPYNGSVMTVSGYGCIFPKGYQPRFGHQKPWTCPIRDCQSKFPAFETLGRHISSCHTGFLLNDNCDGTFSFVADRKGTGPKGRKPCLVVSVTPVDDAAQRLNMRNHEAPPARDGRHLSRPRTSPSDSLIDGISPILNTKRDRPDLLDAERRTHKARRLGYQERSPSGMANQSLPQRNTSTGSLISAGWEKSNGFLRLGNSDTSDDLRTVAYSRAYLGHFDRAVPGLQDAHGVTFRIVEVSLNGIQIESVASGSTRIYSVAVGRAHVGLRGQRRTACGRCCRRRAAPSRIDPRTL